VSAITHTGRRYLSVGDVAARYGVSEWTVYDWARRTRIPFRKHPGSNRLLFLEAELDAFDDGAPLEVKRLARGGKVVTPKTADGPAGRAGTRRGSAS
jgi:excisionase family DNA binding protein